MGLAVQSVSALATKLREIPKIPLPMKLLHKTICKDSLCFLISQWACLILFGLLAALNM